MTAQSDSTATPDEGRGGGPEPGAGAERRPILDHGSRRTFEELSEEVRKRGGERDLRDTTNRVRMAVYSLVGGFFGFMVGFFLVASAGAPFWVPLLLIPVGVVGSYALMAAIVSGAGSVAGTIYMPSGGGAPKKREYSLAESLAVQGRHEDAISTFEMAVAEHPHDPTPYLRIARIHRDELDRLEDAARWFRRARRDARLTEGQEKLVYRELVELYRKAGTPTRAAPELARMAERFAGSPEGEWARGELAEVKRLIAERDG